jgi:hypothetical protein
MLIDKKKLLLILLFFGCCLLYFTLSIPSNSISLDQKDAIRIAKDIFQGNFPLHGPKHSNGMYTFPAFYYFVSPLVYISDEPMFLYGSVAFLYIIGVLLLANYIYKKFGCFECIIFLLFSATHVWSLFFASYFWNPNYIPFFMCLFILSLAKQINEGSSVKYFHLSGILLNIIVQMMPQSIILIPAFAFILFLFKRLPSLLNQVLHLFIQLILVYPWIHHYLFILDGENLKTTGKLFKNFSAIFEYMNFLGGWGLTSEYIDYSFYGTNTYPFTEFFDALLTFSSILMMIMIIFSIYLTFSKISYINLFNLQIKAMNGIDLEKQKLFMALTIINFSCVLFFITGMHMTPHHYQFLTPLLAFNLTLLASFKQHKKIITPLLLLCILMQGSFSYWRAYSEYKKPYVTDIGYSDQFTNHITNNCNADSTAYILDPRGLYFFQSSKGDHDKKSCGKLILVLRDHYTQSEIIRWFLKKNYAKTDMKFKDYLIWSQKNIKEHE